MTGLVLVTHDSLAGALLKSAEMIVGPVEASVSVEVSSSDRADQIMSRVVEAVKSVSGDGVIIMTDLFGGTPSNMAISFLKEGQVEVLTGVNLPMVIEFCSKRSKMPLAQLAAELQRSGREGIIIAGELLK